MHSQEGTGGLGNKGDRMAGTARGTASEVASTAGEQARSLADEARSEAMHVTGDVQSRLREEAREQTRRTSQNLRQWSEELSSMADQGNPQSPVSGVVHQVAQGGRGAADFLDERGVDGLLEEARSFAQRRPMAFLAGAALAGFALGRVLKASSSDGGQAQEGGSPEAISSGERAGPPMPRQSETGSSGSVPPFQQSAASREHPGQPPEDPGTPGRTL
ncbi:MULTISPECIES: hypothetical protein [unclassified Nocardiopsis]|uniref:hypothetical protein n=1 Tax=unclassified Nocardiopsis TaxID=2649073 RepID=UPI00093D6DFA|nr:hypothetical protein [Nocardiopsis sp. TSRI0078]